MPKNFYERERVKSDQGKLNNLGFTLIELLVVISIIGFLATASMVVFNSVRMKGRDAKRVADLKKVATALDLYYDEYGKYPAPNYCAAWYHTWSGWDAASCSNPTTPGLVMTSDNGVAPYLKKFLPAEFQAPLFNKTSAYERTYFYCNAGACPGVSASPVDQHYVLAVFLENPSSSMMQSSITGQFYGSRTCGSNGFYCRGQ